METVSEYADHRTELEEKVRSIEVKKASLVADISSLKRRITALEKCVNTLETALRALRTEKVVSEEKALTCEVEAGYDLPPSTTEGLPV